MKLDDLLTEPSLNLELLTPPSPRLLNSVITAGVTTKLEDPTPFLDSGTVVLTEGLEQSIETLSEVADYVARLASSRAAALVCTHEFADRAEKIDLAALCRKNDLPLILTRPGVPILQVDRFIAHALKQEEFDAIARGQALADECTRIASSQGDLLSLLAKLYSAVGAPVAIYDFYGTVISHFPESSQWAANPEGTVKRGETRIMLPMGTSEPCSLVVKTDAPGVKLNTLLGPASSVIAIQLNHRHTSNEGSQAHIRHLLAQCGAWEVTSLNDIAHILRSIGVMRMAPVTLLMADISREFVTTSWQIRNTLHECFHTVFLTEINGKLMALAQQPRLPLETVQTELLSILDTQPLVLKLEVEALEEVRLSIVHAQDLIEHIDGPQLIPELGLSSIITATSGRGTKEGAIKFLQPLLAHDSQRAISLLPTLEAFLRNNAHSLPTCNDLFIHRNTLNYRIRRIESLLGIDLSTIEAQAVCLLALRLSET
jgi:purine catabolism regulator